MLSRLMPLALLLAFITPAAAAPALAPDLFAGMAARNIGPAGMSGRITDVEAFRGDPNRIVAGAATGGVWLSDDGGLSWAPVFDEEAVHSIGAVAFHPGNPDILWVGTGEANVRNSTSIGGGIYKSADGGKTWKMMGLEGTERINRIALHPTDPDIAYVAALGTLWGYNEDRGVYKTTDGGESWSKILYVDEKTGATDVKMDPANPNKLFAAMWQFRRWPYKFESGGPGSGLYVSHDGGETWAERTPEDGLPKGDLGRIAVAVAPSDPARVYALVEAEDSALIRSDDGGVSWATVNSEPNIAVRPFYYTELEVDPANENRVYNVESRVRVSIDGGKSFDYIDAIDCCTPSNTIHIDVHAMWANPNDPRHLIIGNDGGVAISRDRGETWRHVRNLPLAQFYHVAVDDAHPYNVYGGLQDNGSWRGPAEIWQVGGIRNHHWQEVGFGDGFDTVPDPEIADAGYAMSQGGYLIRWNLDRGTQRLIRPNPPEPDTDLRFNWDAGFAQDPFDAATIYYGSQFVHKSTDRGESWTVISPDLTTDDTAKQEAMRESGGLTPDVTAAEFFTTITAIAPSPVGKGVIWAGTDDGRLHVTTDGGESWTSLEKTVRGVPEGTWIPFIEPSPHDASTAFVVFDNHRRGDMAPYVYRADDYGSSFKRLVDGDDAQGYALAVRQDLEDGDLLWLGTELGLYLSLDGGDGWMKWTAGLPTASVMDLAIQARESDLVIGTHGRGIYVIDDIGALRNRSDEDFQARLKLLDTTDGQQYEARPIQQSRFPGSGEFRAANEPKGAVVTFIASGGDLPHPDPEKEKARKKTLREELTQKEAESAEEGGDEEAKPEEDPKVEVTVADASGAVIRTFKAPIKQGVNRVIWAMQRDGVGPMPPEEREEDYPPAGPDVPPGTYTMTLGFDGEEIETPVAVRADPRSPYGAETVAANYRARLDLMAMQKTMKAALDRIYDARRDIDTLMTLAEEAAPEDGEEAQTAEGEEAEKTPLERLRADAEALRKTLTEMEERFRVPPKTVGIVYDEDKVASKIGVAFFHIASTLDAPSAASQSYKAVAERALADAVAELNRVLSEDLPLLRQAAADAGLGLLAQTPVARESDGEEGGGDGDTGGEN